MTTTNGGVDVSTSDGPGDKNTWSRVSCRLSECRCTDRQGERATGKIEIIFQ